MSCCSRGGHVCVGCTQRYWPAHQPLCCPQLSCQSILLFMPHITLPSKAHSTRCLHLCLFCNVFITPSPLPPVQRAFASPGCPFPCCCMSRYEAVAADGSRSVGMAVSKDASKWKRCPWPVFQGSEAASGAWDQGEVGAPWGVSMSGGRWRLYYAGRDSSEQPGALGGEG